ncbi:M23 family metallopeptidase [Streptomyces sp. NBC_01754]|uniref:M23 family metallopeptidase n=1 Tax=Streptomyces sp. NBC_01754 TaxID=2975930 RepID=UPI002DDA4202|nr:M23 family metallopeptidase [Streptomyces sp. NBC_01754]WSC94396.1 M23 family metallopeptidase [Streptomyces sp. NBC_01754]
MNDQHPHAGYAGSDSGSTGSYDTDPLFGTLPDHPENSPHTTYGSGFSTAYDTPDATYGGYGGTGPYEPQPQGPDPYDTGTHDSRTYDTGTYDTGQWDSGQWDTGAHQQAAPYETYGAQAQQTYDTTAVWMPEVGLPTQMTSPDATGQWDTTGWNQTAPAGQWGTTDTGAFPTLTTTGTAYATGSYAVPDFPAAAFDASGYGSADTGAWDATAWTTGDTPESTLYTTEQTSYPPYEHRAESPAQYDTAEFAVHDYADEATGEQPVASPDRLSSTAGYEPSAQVDSIHDAVTEMAEVIDVTAARVPSPAAPAGRSVQRGGGRGRRRTPAKRSALLTVAVPSACVMSVAGIAAASVSGVGGTEEKKDDTTTMAAADTVKPALANSKLDTQLANLSADAANFADRASRTQERIDLKERQAAEKKKREEEAARREALRPKFVLPVKQHGLSASYGQAGVNWMSVHTGIDFPVQYGTPVMAATDGTVRTQWNSAYGNMAIVTAADGTETWYCHLSTTRIRSGSVKAGDVIAYSGSSGNSTGPHLHFEVRPGGGAAIDPAPWLRSHGVNPN